MKIRIKYFDGATKLQKIKKGNWIDLYANEDVFIPQGEKAMIPLGIALELPKGWEAHVVPRSSTFKTWGIIQTNHMGVIDDTYIGDNDQWHMPVYCLQSKGFEKEAEIKHKHYHEINLHQQLECNTLHHVHIHNPIRKGTWIRKGDKIAQFRIMEVMPEIEFEEVGSFGNIDRGGFGSTGER